MHAPALTPRDALTVARILKVNHAGEHGAIRIYTTQIVVARHLYPDLVQPLSEMLSHEIDHRAKFLMAMQSRRARPCRVMSLWGVGGSVLGLMTALLGRQAIWATTAAVEAAVHRHLDDQLGFLERRDAELFNVITAIRLEEMSHLQTAEAQIIRHTVFLRVVRRVISVATDALIWLSTWGDSTRMAQALAAGRAAAP